MTSLKNLAVMMAIALIASVLYFLVTPLTLTNPTELLARTNPTIYDVLIALFGGAAGMFEQCRKEKGTVISRCCHRHRPHASALHRRVRTGQRQHGVFSGALYLFAINCVFIAIASYIMTKAMGFKQAQYRDTKVEKRTRRIIVATALVFIIPSILSAIMLVNNNNFDRRATAFVQANKSIQNAIIYDYTISHEKGDKIELYLSGEKLDEEQTAALFASANEYGIKEEQVAINENKSAKKFDRL